LNLRRLLNMSVNYTIKLTALHLIVMSIAFLLLGFVAASLLLNSNSNNFASSALSARAENESYWLLLHRKSNIEYLYKGVPGDESQSELIKTFNVKTGIPGERPTPLPHLLGREYFILIGKMKTPDNPETAPYFLTLDVPVTDQPPYGPADYPECPDGCNWELPGYFGLHGVGGDNSKLSKEDPGSSGCIRHSDEDITYLYNNLDPSLEEIRYYIIDN